MIMLYGLYCLHHHLIEVDVFIKTGYPPVPVSEFNSQSPSQFCESRVNVIPRLSLKAYLVLTKILDCSAENGFGFKFASA
ncbi:MAG: hypothetical protein CM15mP127_03770 [Gammaproteobacteria bacterium]|nr:MAG: hypothetical protein CM15mP127_03770 [Gammaproteobacteria bacterium]